MKTSTRYAPEVREQALRLVRCTTGKGRRVIGWEHEAVLEAVQARIDAEPQRMRLHR